MPTMLIVEDDLAIQVCLVDVFIDAGYQVEVCHDGYSATERVRHGKPVDVVLLDWNLPGPDGGEVLAAMPWTAPVVVMTAGRPLPVVADARVRQMLRKPFTLDAVEYAVASALQPLPAVVNLLL